jgi:hypothetical protein
MTMPLVLRSKKKAVPVNVCLLSSTIAPADVSFVQQLAHLTDGIYHQVDGTSHATLLPVRSRCFECRVVVNGGVTVGPCVCACVPLCLCACVPLCL